MIAYLSGAMEYADDEGAGWRNKMSHWLQDELQHRTIDPVIESARIVQNNQAEDYRQWKTLNPDKYAKFIQLCFKNDIDIVRNRADYLICLWDLNVMKKFEKMKNCRNWYERCRNTCRDYPCLRS